MKWIALCVALAGLSTAAMAQTACPPPKVLNVAGACVCPPGTHQAAAANICIANVTCPPPKVLNAAGACVCPPGTHQAAVANICVKN